MELLLQHAQLSNISCFSTSTHRSMLTVVTFETTDKWSSFMYVNCEIINVSSIRFPLQLEPLDFRIL